ncbi:MAG: alpha/beta hydrolase [Bacilli bacterium]|nr:alpha/beta hydrolase [Bacilli bacterium]
MAGYHAAVFEYRHELLGYPDIIKDTLAHITKLRKDQRIARIFLCGFSAGGHLALWTAIEKPDLVSGVILGYPVVSTDSKISHLRSFCNLVGDEPNSLIMDALSLEKRISSELPPVFIWHTFDDQSVPVDNSLKLIEALKQNHVLVEAHLYLHGKHGLSLADETTAFEDQGPVTFAKENKQVSSWFQLALNWIKTIKQ